MVLKHVIEHDISLRYMVFVSILLHVGIHIVVVIRR